MSFNPPQSVQNAAKRSLIMRKSVSPSRRGGTAVGIARARQLAGGSSVSLDTIRRMVSFFARHEVDKKATGFRRGEKGYPSKGKIAWELWGGDAGRRWANSIWRRERAKKEK
tara:strand:+ start:792 stop:1127 length:336 start_codon:yes stop_codon:yes gene_type:complete